jgi:hypothetical protein
LPVFYLGDGHLHGNDDKNKSIQNQISEDMIESYKDGDHERDHGEKFKAWIQFVHPGLVRHVTTNGHRCHLRHPH